MSIKTGPKSDLNKLDHSESAEILFHTSNMNQFKFTPQVTSDTLSEEHLLCEK